MNNLQGVVIESEGADAFFSDILERVEAIESFGSDDPITAKVAVQRVKLYLDDERRYVRLREFVASEGREAREKLFGENAFPLGWRPATLDTNAQNRELAEEFRRRIPSYDRSSERAVGIMAAGGYYASEHQARAFGELLEMTATPPESTGPAIGHWQRLQRYPALRLLYAGGIAAMAAGNWPALKAVLRDTVVSDIHGPKPLALKLCPLAVAERRWGNSLFDGAGYSEPIPEWLYRTLRGPLEEYLPLDYRYEMAFHEFEVLLALVHADLLKEEYPENPSRRDQAPLGRFAIMHYERSDTSTLSRLRSEYEEANHEWEPIRGGLLKQPVSSHGTTRTIDTVGHNFDVIDEMIERRDYF